jgi:hypothetical protein
MKLNPALIRHLSSDLLTVGTFHTKGWTKIFLVIAVSKLLLVKNDIFQIAKKPIRDGRLALPDLKNEFC